MTRGVLLIANNNEAIDYILQSCFSAKQIRDHLGIPVTLITDAPNLVKTKYAQYIELFENIIEYDPTDATTTKTYRDGSFTSKSLQFKNASRAFVYDLSPYDETIVLDTDVLVFNSNYLKCFEQPHDFLIYKNAVDVCEERSEGEFIFISDTGVDFYWATCLFFRKTHKNKTFFDLIKHIQENWNHYRLLYQITSAVFRNDFAFSIAIHIMNGFASGDFAKEFPGKLIYSTDRDDLVKLYETGVLLLVEKPNSLGQHTPLRLNDTNIHFMNKFSLDRVLKNDH